MQLLRNRWYVLGLGLAVLLTAYLSMDYNKLSVIQFLLLLSLVTLFLHQVEEYLYPGYFPRMVNTCLFHSKQPDRYPLNTNTAFIVNVGIGWGSYALAAIFANHALWLGIAAMLVSVGNIFAHTLLFNIKGRTLYNPGMLTALVLFLPLSGYFYAYILTNQLAQPLDWFVGLVLGVILNYVGIIKLIDWLKDKKTSYVFRPFH